MKSILNFTLLICAIWFIAGCKDHDLPDGNILVQGDLPLSRRQQLPATFGPGFGSMTLKFDKTTRVLEYSVSATSLLGKPIAAKIYASAPRGSNGNALIELPNLAFKLDTRSNYYDASATGTVDIPADKAEDLLNGFLYISLLTERHPEGELRGQIDFFGQDFMLLKQELPIDPQQANQVGNTRMLAEMDVSYNKQTKRLSYDISLNFTEPYLSGIFIGGPSIKGTPGPIIMELPNFNINFPGLSGSIVMDGVKLKESELLDGKYYYWMENTILASSTR